MTGLANIGVFEGNTSRKHFQTHLPKRAGEDTPLGCEGERRVNLDKVDSLIHRPLKVLLSIDLCLLGTVRLICLCDDVVIWEVGLGCFVADFLHLFQTDHFAIEVIQVPNDLLAHSLGEHELDPLLMPYDHKRECGVTLLAERLFDAVQFLVHLLRNGLFGRL